MRKIVIAEALVLAILGLYLAAAIIGSSQLISELQLNPRSHTRASSKISELKSAQFRASAHGDAAVLANSRDSANHRNRDQGSSFTNQCNSQPRPISVTGGATGSTIR
jgi:hypothetical protein